MKKLFVVVPFLAALLLFVSVAAPAQAVQSTSFQWAGNFKNCMSQTAATCMGSNDYQSSQWFPTISACNQDLQTFLVGKSGQSSHQLNGSLTCSCSQAIYLQPSCPDYASANASVDGTVQQYGACQKGNSSQCAADLICGNSNTCIPGNLADGASCAQDEQCKSSAGCVQNKCGSSGAAPDAVGTTNTGSSVGTTNTGSSVGVTNTGNSGGLTNPLSFSTIPEFLTAILGLVIKIGGIVIVLMLVYIGFLFVTAQGREEKIKEAREALMWTVIGALILLGAQAIQLGIQATVSALGAGA